MLQMLSESCPPKSTFVPDRDIPDLTGRVVIVTGGNAGIGKETELLKKGAKTYMASRSQERASIAIEELHQETGKIAHFLHCDLADLAALKRSAEEFMIKEPALHVLFNSGGVMQPPHDQLTSDGIDLQFGVNMLGHAFWTICLLPALLEGAKTSPDGKARVVNTASDGAYWGPKEGIRWDTLREGPARDKMSRMDLYFQSKFGNYVFSNELARRYGDQGITSNALNPGHLKTELTRHTSKLEVALTDWMLFPAPMGALTQLYVGTSPDTKDCNGLWFIPWAREGKFQGAKNADELGPELWAWVEEQAKTYASD